MATFAEIDKRTKAFSFVWLLFCFFAAQHYTDRYGMEGAFMLIFMYGVFAAPVWLTCGWMYLHGEKPISKAFLFIATTVYAIWLSYENARRHDMEWLVLLSCGYLWLMTLSGQLFNNPKARMIREGCEGFLIGCWQGVKEAPLEVFRVWWKLCIAGIALGLIYYAYLII